MDPSHLVALQTCLEELTNHYVVVDCSHGMTFIEDAMILLDVETHLAALMVANMLVTAHAVMDRGW
eukprot:jgi/Phyca11/511567/fgenesh2_kg.PHYCAscaffold_90_\